ncbi:complement factor I isoform X2 [Scyliorhinus canicula]|uniref:complement factor I isoform X2 n=1 Tax=Scyliorhinus canicula TaxID=7830 RepID=UPI0018F3C25E|nr:complement factor I isoform X2 [Scyliorhinus canicula]
MSFTMILSVPLLFLMCFSIVADERKVLPSRGSNETETSNSTQTVLPSRGSNETETSNSTQTISKSRPHLQRLVEGCREKRFNHRSCQKVFCQPWERCINGRCECKLPYQCPKIRDEVCSSRKKQYRSYCQLKSIECIRNLEHFSHYGKCSLGNATVSLTPGSSSQGFVLFSFNETSQGLPVRVNEKEWTMHEANVVCRQLNFRLGAETILDTARSRNPPKATMVVNWSNSTLCRGFETSLSECFHLADIVHASDRNAKFAAVKCYDYPTGRECTEDEFTCVNGKCIPLEGHCNGIDDCADLSDELCCKECRKSHHCKSDVCIPDLSVCDGEDDCLAGSDESKCTGSSTANNKERILLKSSLPKISCGKPNVTRKTSTLKRSKRLLGGIDALLGEFPWQIAVYEGDTLNCGGVFIGGCWILTAAHCLRPYHLSDYVVRIAKHNKRDVADNEEILPVAKIIIHSEYNPKTYENDIALIKVVHVFKDRQCIPLSKDVQPVCIPWSEYLFRPFKKCVISGWGQAPGDKVSILRWAELDIFENCSDIYKSAFYDGMECAGKVDGSVDACKGDSGGPLVCSDERDESYVWGVVSWGEGCGKYGLPGVYTKVAYFFEWISSHVGRALISKYNY